MEDFVQRVDTYLPPFFYSKVVTDSILSFWDLEVIYLLTTRKLRIDENF